MGFNKGICGIVIEELKRKEFINYLNEIEKRNKLKKK